jgi:Superinfection immunity protein
VPVISSLITVTVLAGMVMASAACYLLPVLIAAGRRVPGIGAVAVINILLGWTLIGWAAALAMALRPVTPAGPVVQIVQTLPPSPPPPGPRRDAGWAGPPGVPSARPAPAPPLVLPPRPQRPGDRGDRLEGRS